MHQQLVEKKKQKFYNHLSDITEKINKKDQIIIIISGDLNTRIGMQTIDEVIGPHGETILMEMEFFYEIFAHIIR